MNYIKVKNLFDKDIEFPCEVDCIFDLTNFQNKFLKDSLHKEFLIDKTIYNDFVEKQLKTFKLLNVIKYNISESLPASYKNTFIKEVKAKIQSFLEEVKAKRYYKTYISQQDLYKTISSYSVDNKALNAYLLLEQNETIKTNLLGFKNNTKVSYTRQGTSTGRLSSKSQANILTLPRKYRNIFKSSFEKGKLFYIDFVSLEPRIMRKLGGWDCQGDIYEEIMSNLDLDIDRSIVKQAIISAVYGSSKKSLYTKIAKEKVDQLCKYIDEYLCVSKCLEMAQESSEKDHRTNFWGRPLWNNHVKESNVILNNFIQSTAVDVALSGFSNILGRLDKIRFKTNFIIHDALMIDVEEDYIDEFIKEVKQGYNCNILGNFPISVEDLYGTKY